MFHRAVIAPPKMKLTTRNDSELIRKSILFCLPKAAKVMPIPSAILIDRSHGRSKENSPRGNFAAQHERGSANQKVVYVEIHH